MTNDTTNISPTIVATEAADIADIALRGATPQPVEPGTVYAVPDGTGGISLVDTDQWGQHPRAAVADRTVIDSATFVEYLARHATPATEVYADTEKSRVIAIIDSHQGADKPAGWGQHRLTLALEKTKAWRAWVGHDGQWLKQVDFAEFIESRAPEVKTPTSASLLELAQSFQATRHVEFESSERLKDGQTQLGYKETLTAKAGHKGTIVIPDDLLLVLKPYVGGPTYHVTARFRFRLNGTELVLSYTLERPEEILDAAFADLIAAIRDGEKRDGQAFHNGITQPIFFGRP